MKGGVFLLDKEKGRTSAWSSRKLGRIAGVGKSGHLGTLDPIATGLLVVLLGEATKFASYACDSCKAYVTQIRFGVRTDTDDMHGQVKEEMQVPENMEQKLAEALPDFVGLLQQRVPAYSANKHKGLAFHHYARKGLEPPIRYKEVHVDSIELIRVVGETAEISVVCGSGTYIRAIARDLGERVGCGAAMSSLRRTRVGDLSVDKAVSLNAVSESLLTERLLPIGSMLGGHVSLSLEQEKVDALKFGRKAYVGADVPPEKTKVRVYGPDGEFAGICETQEDGALVPLRMMTMRF